MTVQTMQTLPTRRLGRTGLEVTVLGLGCFQFTSLFSVPRAEAAAILDLAFESGINFFDTASGYGAGESEEILGRALVRHRDRNVFVSTKVGYIDQSVVRHLGDAAFRDEEALLRCISHSMWLLRLDYLDALMIHEPDWPHWGINLRTGDAPVVSVLERLKRDGVVGAIGLGCNQPDVIADLLETDRFDVAVCAHSINLLQQSIRERILPVAKKHDVGIIVGAALGQGSLIQVAEREARALIDSPSRHDDPRRGRKLLAVADLVRETGLGPVELMVRYVLGMEEVHVHIAGARERAHLEANLGYVAKGPLPPDICRQIEAIAAIE